MQMNNKEIIKLDNSLKDRYDFIESIEDRSGLMMKRMRLNLNNGYIFSIIKMDSKELQKMLTNLLDDSNVFSSELLEIALMKKIKENNEFVTHLLDCSNDGMVIKNLTDKEALDYLIKASKLESIK